MSETNPSFINGTAATPEPVVTHPVPDAAPISADAATHSVPPVADPMAAMAREVSSAWPSETPAVAPPVFPDAPPVAAEGTPAAVLAAPQPEPSVDTLTAPQPETVQQTYAPPALEALDGARPPFYQETIRQDGVRPRPYRRFRRTVAVVCLVCTLGTATLGAGFGAAYTLLRRTVSTDQMQNAGGGYQITSTRTVFEDGSREGSLADVVALVEPSVVGVSSVFAQSGGENALPFFGQQEEQSTGEGSGIIFSEDAEKVFIATNSHVVSGATAVNVTFAGGNTVPAKSVGGDVDADLAVISVEKSDLAEAGVTSIVVAVFGDSDQMEMGDTVLTIGNALGKGNSATFGIISAKEKTIPIENRELTVLQTDAAINFGNSGGPLINSKGEIVGINTAKLTNYYYAVEGVGYSISSNVAKPILEQLMNDAGPKPVLGITGSTMTEQVAEMYGLPPMGVIVRSVAPDSGAAAAGVEANDIITSMDGQATFTIEQLIEEVQKHAVGETVELKVLRNGEEMLTLNVTLGMQDSF